MSAHAVSLAVHGCQYRRAVDIPAGRGTFHALALMRSASRPVDANVPPFSAEMSNFSSDMTEFLSKEEEQRFMSWLKALLILADAVQAIDSMGACPSRSDIVEAELLLRGGDRDPLFSICTVSSFDEHALASSPEIRARLAAAGMGAYKILLSVGPIGLRWLTRVPRLQDQCLTSQRSGRELQPQPEAVHHDLRACTSEPLCVSHGSSI